MFGFTTCELAKPDSADVRFVSGPVTEHIGNIRAAAGSGTVWVQGGGDLAGQFPDAGALDEIALNIAPTFLRDGRPLLPRDVFAQQLTLIGVESVGQFVVARYRVAPTPAASR